VRTLVLRSIGRVRASFIALALVLAAFQLILIAVAAAFAENGDFERLGQIVPVMLRPAIASALTSFGGMTMIGYFDALIIIAVEMWAAYVATEPAGEIESGLIDLVLARPLPRHRLVTRSLIAMMASTTMITATMAVGTFLGLLLFAPAGIAWPDTRVWFLLVAHLTLIGWCFGAFGLAASAWTRRRATAFGAVAIGALALYLLDVAGLWWHPAELVAMWTPVYYFHGGPLLAGTRSSTRDFAILGLFTMAATAAAYRQFARRDL
jgi:ABC-2 type transport system permease protein